MCWFQLEIAHSTHRKSKTMTSPPKKCDPNHAIASLKSFYILNWTFFGFRRCHLSFAFPFAAAEAVAEVLQSPHMWTIPFHHEFLINCSYHAGAWLNRLTDKLPFSLRSHTSGAAHTHPCVSLRRQQKEPRRMERMTESENVSPKARRSQQKHVRAAPLRGPYLCCGAVV